MSIWARSQNGILAVSVPVSKSEPAERHVAVQPNDVSGTRR